MAQEATYVGIDVAKAKVDVAVRPSADGWEVSNNEAGIRQLVNQLKALEPIMALLEASGGFELHLVTDLASADLPVVIVNPRIVMSSLQFTLRMGGSYGRNLAQV